jgi:hypothetical protein
MHRLQSGHVVEDHESTKGLVCIAAGPVKSVKAEHKKNWLEQLKGQAAAAKRPHVSQNQRQTDQDTANPGAGGTFMLPQACCEGKPIFAKLLHVPGSLHV